MFQRKPRRFRYRTNGRSHTLHGVNKNKIRPRSNHFSNGGARNNFRQTLSAEKLLEKYNNLAKEAMSSGDKTLSENYIQHADHFMRIIENKNLNQNQYRVQTDIKSTVSNKPSIENSSVSQDKIIEEKKVKKE